MEGKVCPQANREQEGKSPSSPKVKGTLQPSWRARGTLWHPCLAVPGRATQYRRVIVRSSDKTWSAGSGNGSPLQYCCCKKPRDTMKGQKIRTPEDEPPGQMSNMLLRILSSLSCSYSFTSSPPPLPVSLQSTEVHNIRIN